MAYSFLIMPDPEATDITTNSIYYANSENHLKAKIRECSSRHPNNPICVYKLNKLQKMITEPVFAMYIVNEQNELIPVTE